MSEPEKLHDDPEEGSVQDSNYYGISTGIVGILIGLALIVLMFALADGFS